jgi:hypothetical protein
MGSPAGAGESDAAFKQAATFVVRMTYVCVLGVFARFCRAEWRLQTSSGFSRRGSPASIPFRTCRRGCRALVVLVFVLLVAVPVASASGNVERPPEADVDVDLSANGNLADTYAWTIAKSASPATQSPAVGSSGSVQWTITTSRSAAPTAAAWFDGRVCVQDTRTVATQGLSITATLTGRPPKTPITTVQVDTSAKPELGSHERYCYPYKVALSESAIDPGGKYKVTAVVTITNGGSHHDVERDADGERLPETPTTVDSSITVADTSGKSFTFTDGGSQGYDQSIPCSAAGGAHTITARNTATITSTGQQATAQATIHCTAATSVTTVLSGTSVAAGGSVSDQATINGAPAAAGGTISYKVYSDSVCQSLFADATPADNVISNGKAPASKEVTFGSSGTYYWQAVYSGDPEQSVGGSTSDCTSEKLVVTDASAGSTQALIEADLDAGRIDYGTALIYRAWALFWDPRLPARYDGTGSTGEDLSLFSEIEAALPSLPPDQQAELRGWITRPTDPRSPFGPAAAAATRTLAATAAATDTPVKCEAPNSWLHLDDPNDSSDQGFRAWICAAGQADADKILSPVLITLAGIKQLFTQPEPAGMGPPVPDTLSADNGGNGKIDVYLLTTNQCRDRNGSCVPIPGKAGAAAVHVGPIGQTPGFPAHSSSGYMLIPAPNPNNPAQNPDDPPTLAHEFFHILQYAHTVAGLRGESGNLATSWYVEASATWAEWNAQLRQLSKTELYDDFKSFQDNNLSLLDHSPNNHQYDSWIWPLFQELEAGGATSVYQTWASAESASDLTGIDTAVNSQLPFADTFRTFSVRNLQPPEYFFEQSTGLESDSWQSKITDFPNERHLFDTQTLGLGPHSIAATVSVLAAQDDRFIITDPQVRQITIDLSPLQNAGSADLDIVGELEQDAGATGPHQWRRIKASSSTYTLCRDNTDEDFSLFYTVVSNHASTRIAKGGPDPAAAVTGFYTVEAKDHCDIPIRYDGTFKMQTTSSPGPTLIDFNATGHVKYTYTFTAAACDAPLVPPTPTGLAHCYQLDSAQETWTAPEVTSNGCLYKPRPAEFSYTNDQGQHGGIEVIRRTFDPAFANIYHVSFSSSTKTMLVDLIDVGSPGCGSGSSPITIRLPALSIVSDGCYNDTPAPKFTGWPLSGSCTFRNVGAERTDTTTWSWDLSPIFAP